MTYKNQTYQKCLINECTKKAILSHSIQKSKILDLLCEENHVIGIGEVHDKVLGPVYKFQKIGRNEATTFQGLCNKHDTEIFLPIENQEINFNSPEHLFLISYRAILRELHAKISAARKFSLVFNTLKDKKAPTALITQAEDLAATYSLDAYSEYKNKIKYDFIYQYKAYEYCIHKIIPIATKFPSIAASSVVSVGAKNETDYARTTISILPMTTTQTIILYSFLEEDEKQALNFLQNLSDNNQEKMAEKLSSFFTQRCENFVISPNFFKLWDSEKKENFLKAFTPNVIPSKNNLLSINLFAM